MAAKTFLTSIAVPKSDDGNYPYEIADWLIPHETIRRELLRGVHALKAMDPVQHPWKAYGFQVWLAEFLWPSIHAHHDVEETIVGPHFKALGEQPTFGDTKTHKELLDLMDVITKDTNVLAAAAAKVELEGIGHSKVTPATDQAVSAALEALRNSWTTFKDYMWIHLCEEEKAWPAIYKKVGPEGAAKVLQKILKEDMAKKGPALVAFQAFGGAIVTAMGVDIAYPNGEGKPAAPEHALHLDPWCSAAFASKFMAGIPWVPRKLIFPGWQKTYITKWKMLVDSLSGDDNVLAVSREGLPKPGGCCIVM